MAATLAACSPSDAPRPASGRASPSPAASAAAAVADPNDPAEPGLSDLARLARYVFRAMQRHEAACRFDNPFRDKLSFAFTIEVARGRMIRTRLARAAIEAPIGTLSLLKTQWPPELPAYVTCLASHLESIVMDPPPADGTYEPLYSYAGHPDGKPLP